ncbi:hypothetical protein MBLNU459_g1334t1 [Dothideomycetes sp. NU459]
MAITQLLAEYLISGFSVILPELKTRLNDKTTSDFWPASILSLLLCSTILTFARVSDMYGGYPVFMFAVAWLCVWSLLAGVSNSTVFLDICRAMQGLAIAAYTPSSYALIGTIYPTGPRRNLVLGIYGACAPLGFFAGICTSAALPPTAWQWYFWIAATLAMLAFVMAYLSVPSDRSDRLSLDLQMDWAGAVTITSGLVLVAYSLSASSAVPNAWKTPQILAPFLVGSATLLAALYIELRLAPCPLLPRDFFAPKSVKPFVLACLFFYGAFGIWLFTSTAFLGTFYDAHGMKLVAYFTPLALGGVLVAVVGSSILHRVPVTLLLLLSGCAWVASPLLLAFADVQAGYWPFVLPSMVAATLGIDLCFTISGVFLSSVQPAKWQGLAGAVSSILVNLGISFSLGFVQILADAQTRSFEQEHAEGGAGSMTEGEQRELLRLTSRSAFLFAAASAAVGVVIVVLFVRISREVVGEDARVDEPMMLESGPHVGEQTRTMN